MLQLFDNPLSPYALKVRVVLYEKEIPFERHEITSESQREELLRLNPRGEVPALRDGDTVVYDSKVMCEYIEEKWRERPLLPTDPARRAAVRARELIADTQLDACMFVIGLFKFFRPDLAASHPAEGEKAAELFQSFYESLDAALGSKEYFAGEFTRADITTFPHVAFATFVGVPVKPEQKALTGWVERMQARPSVQRAIAEALEAVTQSQNEKDPFFSNQRLHWRSDRVEYALRVGLGPWLLDELKNDRAFFSPVP